ncbi:MAG: class I SAM-dependent methyltransferase [Thermoguttaceae bacterium]|jgi:SAM-dependent methyltransferase
MMPGKTFDDLTDVYEVMIDWPKRLTHEAPFFRTWFERVGAGRVLDAACGTGRHAAMFHGWQLCVEGADISPKMIERARAVFGEPDGLRWVVRGFQQPVESAEPLDAVLCVGNSLALAADAATAARAVRQLLLALRPGGVLIVQVLNLWHLPDGPCVWQKCRRHSLPQGESLIVKGVHRCGGRGYVELLVAAAAGEPLWQADSVPFLGLERADLERMAADAGAAEIQFFGGYESQPYDRQTSVDLILVARK